MLSAKKDRWRMRVAMVGALALLLLMVAVVLMSTAVQAHVSMVAVQSVPTVQPTPTEDATVTALNKQKLVEDVGQQQHTLGNWVWSNATALLSSLVLAIAGVFTLFRYLRDQRSEREKQREDRQAEEKKRAEERERQREDRQTELDKRAEERFQSAVIGLGDEKEGAQIGAAILLRTFLHPGYEQFYTQTFDLAVANLRRRGASKIVQHQLWDDPQNSDAALSLTTLDQALIVVFKEAFPLARDQEKREPASLDATAVQLDNAYLVGADLKQIWGPRASLRKADLSGADLTRAILSGASLDGANLREAILSHAYLIKADLSGADLSGANLDEASLDGANLSGASLSGAHLREAILIGVDLSGADLSGADLSGAILSGASLDGAILTRASLDRANLDGIEVSRVTLNGAELTRARFSGAKGLTREQRAAYKAQGALADEEPASNVSQEPVSTSPPLEPGSVQSPPP